MTPFSLRRKQELPDQMILWLNRISATIACIAVFLMTWMITLNVFMRFVFNKPSELVEEYSGFLFVFIVFMGLGYITRLDMNISVELIYKRLSPKVRTILDFVTTLLSFVVIGVYCTFSIRVLLQSIRWRETSVVTLTPLWIPSLFMVLGLSFLILELISQLIKSFLRMVRTEDQDVDSP